MAWLIPLTILGLILFIWHFVNAYLNYEAGELWFYTYLRSVDTVWNYVFLFVTAIWSTLYAESWKRK